MEGQDTEQADRCANVQHSQDRDVGPMQQGQAGQYQESYTQQGDVALRGAVMPADCVTARPPVPAKKDGERGHAADTADEMQHEQWLRRGRQRHAAERRTPDG